MERGHRSERAGGPRGGESRAGLGRGPGRAPEVLQLLVLRVAGDAAGPWRCKEADAGNSHI